MNRRGHAFRRWIAVRAALPVPAAAVSLLRAVRRECGDEEA